jgi:hypothetical protein
MRAAGEPVAAKRVVDQLVGDDAGVVCAVSDADKRRFAEGPRVADAEPHRLRRPRQECEEVGHPHLCPSGTVGARTAAQQRYALRYLAILDLDPPR